MYLIYKLVDIPNEAIFIDKSKKITLEKSSEHGLVIKNFYNSNTLLCVYIENNCLHISDSLNFSPNFLDKEINLSEFVKNNHKPFKPNSINIPHGYYIQYKNNIWKKERIRNKKYENIRRNNLAYSLEKTLIENIDDQNIAISFSGGLDSTAILYTCHHLFKNIKNLVAFTWWNKGSSYNDLNYSRNICNKLGITLIEIEIKPEDLFIKLDVNKHLIPNHPNIYLAFLGFIEKYVKIIDQYFNQQHYTIIDGSGGDHICVEAPDLNCISKFSRKKIIEFSQLYSLNFFQVLHSYLKNKNFNTQEYIKKLVHDALFLTSRSYFKHPNHKIFFPFATEEMIESSLLYNIEDTFDQKYSRLHFRKELFEKYQSKDFFRINKGSMTGAYQKSIALNLKKLSKALNSEEKQNKIIHDYTLLNKQLNLSSMGVKGVPADLMIFIICYLIIDTYQKREV